MKNHKFGARLTSGNGMGRREVVDRHPEKQREQDKVAGVEMPPGGWVDGTCDEPGSPGGEHAYEIDLKIATSDNVVRLVSHAYRGSAN